VSDPAVITSYRNARTHPAPALAAMLLAVALSVHASEFGGRYPTGAITDRARAEQALREADAEAARIERESVAREAECHKAFLVNRCREEVRRDRLAAERELRRVRIEARDVQRRLDAEDAAQRRARANEPAAKAVPGARESSKSREIAPDEAARNRAAYEKRIEEQRKAAAAEQARASERAENARAYREKQEAAERRAQEKAAERKENEQRRAERRKQIEAKEAQREEVRRKAEAAAKAAQP
jgi:colicin import membrane protein